MLLTERKLKNRTYDSSRRSFIIIKSNSNSMTIGKKNITIYLKQISNATILDFIYLKQYLKSCITNIWWHSSKTPLAKITQQPSMEAVIVVNIPDTTGFWKQGHVTIISAITHGISIIIIQARQLERIYSHQQFYQGHKNSNNINLFCTNPF